MHESKLAINLSELINEIKTITELYLNPEGSIEVTNFRILPQISARYFFRPCLR